MHNDTSWPARLISHAHFVIPFGMGALAGAFGSVLFGAISGTGVALTVYLSSLTAVGVTTVGLLSAWALASRSDAIKCRRIANLARLRIRALRKEWELIQHLLEVVGENPWTPGQLASALTIFRISTKIAESAPDFSDILDDEEDIKNAQLALDVFAFTARRFAVPDDLHARTSFVTERLTQDFGAVMAGMHVDSLRAAETHFSAKGR